jgi:hypothetical protein
LFTNQQSQPQPQQNKTKQQHTIRTIRTNDDNNFNNQHLNETKPNEIPPGTWWSTR